MMDKPEWYYTQSAVIPFQKSEDGVQIMLITSRRKKRWIIPKGVIEPEMSPAESAAKEAFEEAGIRGRVFSEPIGEYQYQKWGGTCTVKVFSFEISEILDEWEESEFRERKFMSVKEACDAVNEQELKQIIKGLT